MPVSRRVLPALFALLFLAAATVAGVRAARSPNSGGADGRPAAPAASPAAESSPEQQPAAPAQATAPAAEPAVATPPSLTLLGSNDLGGRGFTANVRTLNGFAYVGSWGSGALCPALGVRVVDLADPARPAVVASAARFPGTSAEDIVPLHVSTPFFTGDLLAVGIQRCQAGAAPAGLALVDITDPRTPVSLGFFPTGAGPRGVHELDVTEQNGRILALLAVPSSRSAGEGDFRIVDITDPRNPAQLSSWDVQSGLGPTSGSGCYRWVYDHSARAGAGGSRAYLSYWDAGEIILDISDPTAPRLVGRAFEPDVEGAIHSADEMQGGLLLVTEEVDFSHVPPGLRLRVESGGVSEEVAACEAASARPLTATGALAGPLRSAGTLCATSPERLTGAIALTDSGGCTLAVKAGRAAAAGAQALIVIGMDGPALPVDDGGGLGLPLVGVSRADGDRLRALVQGGPASVVMPSARPWGGLRVWDIGDPAHPRRRSLFLTEAAQQFPPPGPGVYTVHNALSLGRYALLSWFSDGVRLVDLGDPDHPREAASFVPPAVADPFGYLPPAPLVWGVALSGDLVVASDMNGGLYVLRLEGVPARP